MLDLSGSPVGARTSAIGAERKLMPEFACFRFCPEAAVRIRVSLDDLFGAHQDRLRHGEVTPAEHGRRRELGVY